MSPRLFVYGTLAPGRSNANVLADVSGTWEPARLRGTVLDVTWGPAAGYPGLVLDEDADSGATVRAFVYVLSALGLRR